MSDSFRLQKIILIDSFWPGKSVLLKLDGHTNLSGTNGAGKTTFLRLMQLFWGERPSNIVGGSGSKKGFLDYYLPRGSSCLVYEYQRPHGQVCHVMVQSDGRGAKYKFIDAPYRQDFYIGENGLPRDSHSIERLYKTLNAEASRFVAVDDYCSIIQCHQVSSGKRWLRPLQQRFAMGFAPMTHIEKVIGSVIEKIGDFDVIKQMLIDISRNKLSQTFLQNEDDQQPFQLNKQHIDAWLSDLTAAREIEAKRGDFDELLQTIGEYKETLKTLSHIHALALDSHKTGLKEKDALEQSLSELNEQRDRLQQEHDSQLDPKTDTLIECNERLKELNYQIDALETQKLEYERQDAESFAFRASLLEQHVERQVKIKGEIEALESKTQEIKAYYEKQLDELRHTHDSQTQTFERQCAEAQFAQEKSLRETDEAFQQRKEELRQAKESRLHPVKEQKSQWLTEFEVEKSRLRNPPIPEALAEQQVKNRQALEAAVKENRLAYQARHDAQNDYQSKLDQFRQIEQKLKDKNTELRNLRERHAQCLKRLRPEPGTLQHYLDNEVEGWQNTIGRVIAPELLDHSGLDPQWNENGGDDFYGLRIALDTLAERSYLTADKLRLEQEEKNLFDNLNALGVESEGLDASLNAANTQREQAKAELDKVQQRIKRVEKNEAHLQDEANALADRIKVETEKARRDIELNMQRLSSDIEGSNKTIAAIEAEHEQAMHALHDEHLGRKGVIESDGQRLIATIREQIAADTERFEQEKRRIQQQLNSELKDSGADDTIVKLSEQLHEAKRLEKEAIDFQRKHEEYQTWLQQRWQEHPELCRRRGDCESKSRQLNDAIEQLKQEFKRRRAQLNQQIAAQQDQLKKRLGLLNQLERCMELLKSSPPTYAEELHAYAADTLPRLTQETVKDRKRQEHAIHSGKQILVQLFGKHHRSQLAEAWQQALAAPGNSGPFFQNEALEIEQPLIDVLQMVEHVRQATAQQIELHATGVNAFYQHLYNFDRAIKHTGSELSKYISEEQYFVALGEITVNVRSKMSDLEYWQALKKFGDNYSQYRDNAKLIGHRDIPDELIQAMNELTALLPSSGFKIKHLSLFDIEFSIYENGQLKHARNAKELKDVSSTGLSYLALITFFTGVTAMLRKQNPTVVCWPIDELGDLAPENIEAMMNLLAKQNIQILSATPTADRHVLALFSRRYLLNKQRLHEVELPASKLDQLLNAMQRENADV
ncbi:ATP-binding protein [Methylotuvimicrobium buryatense]|uniref:ATP-binding protein n=1 Tax=Methylotuvimicrobium buryatense TaxID=95641 RepID=A0A4V1IKE0_METBY|nr:ATP-binding protein [Methylotuvimicrobium buryatense]QCW84575.1 ATP-binding protein [Methylotuvimicrobium buryatense]